MLKKNNNNDDHKSKPLQQVCFKLGREEFGVDILKVREIVRYQQIARVPQTSDFIAGVINLRGNIIPVIDLRKKVGLPNLEKDGRTRIIVFYVGEKLVGMIVDQVDRVIRLRQDQIEPPPDIGLGKIQEFVSGVGKVEKGLFILLNTEKLLTDEEILPIEEIRRIREAARSELKSNNGDSTSADGRSSSQPQGDTR
jgi:purine-binding chemotaxis protein CheW